MKYAELLKTATAPLVNKLEEIRAESEINKFISEKNFEIDELQSMILRAKCKNPISIGEILGLMNKRDLAIRGLKQAEELKNELF